MPGKRWAIVDTMDTMDNMDEADKKNSTGKSPEEYDEDVFPYGEEDVSRDENSTSGALKSGQQEPQKPGQADSSPGDAPGEEQDDPAATDADAEPVLSVLKAVFSFFSINVHGMIQVFFNRRQYQAERISAVVDFDRKIFDTNPELSWQDFEEEIISLLGADGFNFRLSNELKYRIDEIVNYQRYEEFRMALEDADETPLRDFITEMLEQLYGVQDMKLLLDVEMISKQDFNQRADDEQVVLIDEDGMSDMEDFSSSPEKVLQGEAVLAPIFGTSVRDLAVGDTIAVRVQENPEHFYGMEATRPRIQEAVVKSVIHDALAGHTIFAELRPGVLAKLVEAEDVRIKSRAVDEPGLFRRLTGNFLSWYIIFFVVTFIAVIIIISL